MNKDFFELNLPKVKLTHSNKKHLTMDEFDKFNEEDLSNCFDRESYLIEKRKRVVTVPFVLK